MKSSRRLASLRTLVCTLTLALSLPGCLELLKAGGYTGKGGGFGAFVDPQGAADEQAVKQLEKARADVKANPGGVDQARAFAQQVLNVHQTGVVERKALNGDALLTEANNALDAAAIAFPDQKAEVMFSKGGMLLSAGKTEDGIAALRESMDAKPSPRAAIALIAELDKKGDPKKEIIPMCKKARPNAASDETRYALLDSCLEHSHAPSVEEGLKWAGVADVNFYKKETLRLEAEAEQRRREEAARAERQRAEAEAQRQRDEEERRRQQASMNSGSSGSSASSGSSGWRVTLKNNCNKTVRLFLGQRPKWGSGTNTTLGSNTISSYSGSAGDMIWIIDDQENGLSSITPSGNQNVQILSSCTGFAPN